MEQPEMIDLKDGFSSIRKFHIQQYSIAVFNGEWQTIYTGERVEACKIINLPEYVNASKIRLNIISSKGIPSISHFSVADRKSKGLRAISK